MQLLKVTEATSNNRTAPEEVIKSDLVMRSLSLFLACEKQFKTPTFPKYGSNAITIEGWAALATFLRIKLELKRFALIYPTAVPLVEIYANHFLIANAVRENTSLKKVIIPICSTCLTIDVHRSTG